MSTLKSAIPTSDDKHVPPVVLAVPPGETSVSGRSPITRGIDGLSRAHVEASADRLCERCPARLRSVAPAGRFAGRAALRHGADRFHIEPELSEWLLDEVIRVGSLPRRGRFALRLLTRVWPAPPMRCNPRKGGSPRPAGSVPRGGRRPDRDSSTHTTTEQEKTKCHFHHPPTQRL